MAAATAAVVFSSQPGVTSHGVSRGIITWFLDLFQKKISEEAMGWCNFFLRRGAHLLIYCVLGAGLSGLFYLQKRVPPWIPAMILGTLFAATDEYHQFLTGDRTATPKDVLLDACGVALGCILTYVVVRKLRKKRTQ